MITYSLIINFLIHLGNFAGFLVIIIFLHELSHFLACRLTGCGVDIVSIGFGKPFYRKEFGETIYQISPFLVGGYCQLKDELKITNDPTSFTNLTYRNKVIISSAGCATNIITGIVSFLIGWKLYNFNLLYFGYLSFMLGITNLFPFIPCLDGGYIFYIPILIKKYGQEKGLQIFERICTKSFKILMILNIICLPYLVYLIWKGLI